MNPLSPDCIDSSEVNSMIRKTYFPGIAAAAGMLILILDSRTALSAAAEGIRLCLWTVIPSLFPFFVLSGLLVSALMGSQIPLLCPLGNLLGIPKGAESLLISGFLGGYPVGAKAIRDAWKSGSVSRDDAARMLTFCSNAGPAFLFGMAAPLFPDKHTGWVLWFIQITSALLTGLWFRKEPEADAHPLSGKSLSVPEALEQALRVTAGVCGWIILFRIICSFAEKWILFFLPEWGRSIIVGFLELANGCTYLQIPDSQELRFVICNTMLSFGGICVLMQTASVIGSLPLKWYLKGKITQMIISMGLACLYLRFGWAVLPAAAGVLFLFPAVCKKEVDFSPLPVYNKLL